MCPLIIFILLSLSFFLLLKTQWTRPNSRTNWPGPHPVSICSNIFGSISGRHQGRVCSRHVVSVERLFKKPRTVTGSRRHVGSISSRFITGSWIQDQHLYVRVYQVTFSMVFIYRTHMVLILARSQISTWFEFVRHVSEGKKKKKVYSAF